MNEQAAPKRGRVRTGWALVKSAWHVLKLDKELAAIPALSAICSLLLLIPFGIVGWLNTEITRDAAGQITGGGLDFGNWNIAFWATMYIVLTFAANFFAAAIAYGAIERFKGGDPTVGGSLNAAWRHAGSIFGFSVLAATVGLVLNMIEERVPFAGRIAVWLANAAWSIATIFAIPIIVTSDQPVKPLAAVRQSASLIKKTWGESVVANLSVALVGIIVILTYGLSMGLLAIALSAGLGMGGLYLGLGLLAVSIIGIMVIALVLSTLSAITRAAVFYYATTGSAPESFDQELMRAAMTPKKARKVFA